MDQRRTLLVRRHPDLPQHRDLVRAASHLVQRRDAERPNDVEQYERDGHVLGAEHRHLRGGHHELLGDGPERDQSRDAHPDGE